MEPTLVEFREIFPEFASSSDARVQYFMDLATAQVNTTAFGDCYAQAVYLLTAHNLTMMDPSRASSGSKSMEKVGDLAVSYDTSSGTGMDAEFNQTQYGKQFLQLRNSKVISPLVLD